MIKQAWCKANKVVKDGEKTENNYSLIESHLSLNDFSLWQEVEYYYNSLEDAVSDINNASTALAISNKSSIKVIDNNIFILDNTTLNNPLTISSTINWYFNSKQFNCNSLISVTGCLNIYSGDCKVIANSTFLDISGHCSINGGKL